MRSAVKAAVVLLVTLPMLAYVVGRLAAAPPEDAPRTPVILDSPASRNHTPAPESDPEDEAEDDVHVVNPTPTRVVGQDDDADDDRDDREPEPDGDDLTDDDTSGGD